MLDLMAIYEINKFYIDVIMEKEFDKKLEKIISWVVKINWRHIFFKEFFYQMRKAKKIKRTFFYYNIIMGALNYFIVDICNLTKELVNFFNYLKGNAKLLPKNKYKSLRDSSHFSNGIFDFEEGVTLEEEEYMTNIIIENNKNNYLKEYKKIWSELFPNSSGTPNASDIDNIINEVKRLNEEIKEHRDKISAHRDKDGQTARWSQVEYIINYYKDLTNKISFLLTDETVLYDFLENSAKIDAKAMIEYSTDINNKLC